MKSPIDWVICIGLMFTVNSASPAVATAGAMESFIEMNWDDSDDLDESENSNQPAVEPLTSLEEFKKSTQKKWKFSCNLNFQDGQGSLHDPEFSNAFRQFFIETLYEGSKRIYEYNPRIGETLRHYSKKKLKVRCKKRNFESVDYSAIHRTGILGQERIMMGASGPKLFCYLSQNKDIARFCSEQKIKLTQRNIEGLKATLLHESLHAMNFDTLPVQVHNDSSSHSEMDAVYSCAYLAYGQGLASRPVLQQNLVPKAIQYPNQNLDLIKGKWVQLQKPTLQGGKLNRFSISPELPKGLKIHEKGGFIYGRPEVVIPRTTYTVIATGPMGRASAQIQISVSELKPDSDPKPLPDYISLTKPEVDYDQETVFFSVINHFVTPESCRTCAITIPSDSSWMGITNGLASFSKDTDEILNAEKKCQKKSISYRMIEFEKVKDL